MIYNRPQLPVSGNISREDLQRLSDDFTVTLDPDDIADVAAELGAASAALNYLQNNDWRTWPTTTLSLPTTWTQTATGWYAKAVYSPSATTSITIARSEDAVHDHVIYCASITGEPNGTECKIGQRLSSSVAAALLEDMATLTIELENKTGSTVTPELVFESCDTRDDFSATTSEDTWTLDAIASNARTTITKTIDLSGFSTAARRGGILYVRLTGLTAGAKEWRVYYSRLEPGQTATPRRIDRENSPATTESVTLAENHFVNASLSEWTRFSMTAIEDKLNSPAEGWYIIPNDSSHTVAQVASAPDERSIYALQITGATFGDTADFAQDVPRHIAAGIADADLVFSCAVYNGTGAGFTP